MREIGVLVQGDGWYKEVCAQNDYYWGVPSYCHRPNEMSLILALVRLYLTRIDSHEEVARTNKNLD